MSKTNLDEILGTSSDEDLKDDNAVENEVQDDKSSVDEVNTESSEEVVEEQKETVEESDAVDSSDKQSDDSTTEAEAEEAKEAEAKEADSDKVETAADKVDETEETISEDESSNCVKSVYPYEVKLASPVTTYRGPGSNFAGKPFGGTITVLGVDIDGYLPVSFVRSGVGLCKGYMLKTEVDKWKSLK